MNREYTVSELFLRDVRWGLGGPPVDVRVRAGRVAAIEPRLEPGADATVVDGRGGTLLPGLVDAHVHMGQWASVRRRVSVADASSAVVAVELAARHAPPGDGLVLGYGFRDGLWTDQPHKDLLERALPGRAVALFSNDLHTCWLSPAALSLLGRDHPTGVLVEADTMRAMADLQSMSESEVDAWVLDAAAAAAARGLTAIVDFEYADTVADWTRRVALRPPVVRVGCAIARYLVDTAIERGLRTGEVVADSGGLLNVGPLKVFVDGSLNTRTAYCHDPYPGRSDHGLLETPPEELVALMTKASAHGLIPAVHAIGDRANTIALDAFETVGCPGRIEHAQLMRGADLGRFARLGVVAGVQPAHQPDDRDIADRHWAGRTDRAFPYRALLDAGATLEIGSDAPVSPLNPWDGIASAVSRTDDDRPGWHPEQAISLPDALRAASAGRSAVRVGDVADLTVTEHDPGECPPHDLREMPVTATVLAGRLTHQR
jgi:predicted amidohydrolase YtcJ